MTTPSPTLATYGVTLLCVCAIASGQILFKLVSGRIVSIEAFLHDQKGLLLLFTALAIYGMTTFGWIYVLHHMPLNRAYMFMALSYFLVPLAAHFMLHEPFTLPLFIGGCVIALGVWITTLGNPA